MNICLLEKAETSNKLEFLVCSGAEVSESKHHTSSTPVHLIQNQKLKLQNVLLEICLVCICAYSSIHLRGRRPQLKFCIGLVQADAHLPASKSKSPKRGLPVFILVAQWFYSVMQYVGASLILHESLNFSGL